MLYDSDIWLHDLDTIIKVIPDLDKLEKKSVLITGASGLVCSAIADVLIRLNETYNTDVHIYLAGRSETRMRKRYGKYLENEFVHFLFFDAEIGLKICADDRFDYIIYGASYSSPQMIIEKPVQTMMGNIIGLKSSLDHIKQHCAGRLLFISSSEIYGKKEKDEPYKEGEYGFIDLLNSRNSYSIAKRAAETLCVSYYDEYGVDSVIVRPGHVYGPTASRSDNHVSSVWAYAAANSEDIVMKSNGAQIRSYCYCLDCASAILTVLLKGESVHAYNISNPNSVISIKEMAELMTASAGVSLIQEEATETERKIFNPMSNSSLDSSSLQALGWRGMFDAKTGFTHTIEILKSL